MTKRIIIAAIGIPIGAFVIWYGGLIFVALISVICSSALAEFYKLTSFKNSKPHYTLAIFFTFIIHFSSYFLIRFKLELLILAIIILISLFIIVLGTIELFSNRVNPFNNILSTLAGLVYINFLFLPLLLLREFKYIVNHITPNIINSQAFFVLYDYQDWATFFFAIFSSIWVCDSAAYFIGKAIGKNKLYQRISPKKTWEGTIAGIILGSLYFWAFVSVAKLNIPIFHIIILSLLITAFAQIGDLAESQIKRDVGIKDSSTILPGHGGILDRFDSPMYVFPLVFIYLTCLLFT